MSEVLMDATPAAPSGDALADQANPQGPVDVRPEAVPAPEKKPMTADQARADTVRRAVEKTLGAKPAEVAAEPKSAKDAAEAKPADATAKVPDAKTDDGSENKSDRGPDGKFKAATPKADDVTEPKQERPRASAHKEPPARFDDAAKAEWEALPENTRGAVHRMQRELESGIEKYKASADEFETVRKYADMARQSGTDLKTALGRYVEMENELRRDPIAGLQAVVANLGLKGPSGQPATLRDIAAFVLGQKPDQVASRQEAEFAALRRENAEMKQTLSGLIEHVRAQQADAAERAILGDWDEFRATNPNAGLLEAEIADFLTRYPASGNITVRERLADALAWAEARFPDKTAAHTRVDDVAAQTRDRPARQFNPAGAKSISGAPSGSQSVNTRKLSRKEAIEKAIRAAGL